MFWILVKMGFHNLMQKSLALVKMQILKTGVNKIKLTFAQWMNDEW